jgi:hypothetical protein
MVSNYLHNTHVFLKNAINALNGRARFLYLVVKVAGTIVKDASNHCVLGSYRKASINHLGFVSKWWLV